MNSNSGKQGGFGFGKLATLGSLAVGGLLVLFTLGSIVEITPGDGYQVSQGVRTGNLTVRDEPGPWMQVFDSVTDYKRAVKFSPQNSCVLDGETKDGIKVTFRDGADACVEIDVTYNMPVANDKRLELHRQRPGQAQAELVFNNAIEGALKQTANLFGAEETYSTERARFIRYFTEQLKVGIYQTRSNGQINEVMLDENGNPKIAKQSVFAAYGASTINEEVLSIDFDAKTDDLIKARKEAEQQETLARAEAEQAKQNALTAEEKGKAEVARVKYEALAVKERAVIEAQKKTAVEQEQTLQAIEQAKQELEKGQAEAAAAKLKVEAGLSPRERAEIDRDTKIGIAQALAQSNWPKIMVTGGGEGGHINPFDAVGLQSMMDITERMGTVGYAERGKSR